MRPWFSEREAEVFFYLVIPDDDLVLCYNGIIDFRRLSFMICPGFPDPIWFFFSPSPDISPLLYYSHFPPTLIALALGIYVYSRNPKMLAARVLFAISVVFLLWVLSDLVAWTNNNSAVITFTWSIFGILYAILSLLTVYFVYTFLDGRDISFGKKLIFGALLLPIIVLTPTQQNIKLFFLNACGASEGMYFTGYYYAIGFLAFLWILGIVFVRARQSGLPIEERRKMILFGFGVEFFLLSFFVSGFLASFLVDYANFKDFGFEQYGLFGMPVFMALLVYIIVRYRAFDIKLLGVQALIIALAVIIGSQLFFVQSTVNFVLTQIGLLLVIVAGYVLIRSVKLEIRRKEELQIMADKLAVANENLRQLDAAKSEFISIASHQLRTPLTAIKGFLSLLLEGSYGKVTPRIEDVLNKIYTSNERLIHLVEDLLNLSRIEAGRIEYKLESVHVEDLLKELHSTFSIIAKQRSLGLDLQLSETPLPTILVDFGKIREVVSNTIDNAIKYTEKGSVTISAEVIEDGKYVRVAITDTGVGIPAEELPYLFQKFSRGKDPSRLHANGTGLGLYVGRKMVEAMNGRISVTSPGAGQGSTFAIDIPVG